MTTADVENGKAVPMMSVAILRPTCGKREGSTAEMCAGSQLLPRGWQHVLTEQEEKTALRSAAGTSRVGGNRSSIEGSNKLN